jgi:hypothetical protein
LLGPATCAASKGGVAHRTVSFSRCAVTLASPRKQRYADLLRARARARARDRDRDRGRVRDRARVRVRVRARAGARVRARARARVRVRVRAARGQIRRADAVGVERGSERCDAWVGAE